MLMYFVIKILEHVIIQQTVRTHIIEMYENIPHLKQWIEELPLQFC